MRSAIVILFAMGCVAIANAALTPDLGYVRLLKGDAAVQSCDGGTKCSGGCCPNANYDCCHDGQYCAADVKQCPGCPNDPDGATATGGWCKEFDYYTGIQTENTPCCQDPDKYCNYADADHSGNCANAADEFCDDDGFTKCGHNCCTASEECCLDNTCAPIDGCPAYCGGDLCGPLGSEICCLPPNGCCSDGSAFCDNDTTNCKPATPCGTPCPDAANEEFCCDGIGGTPACCPNGLHGCYDSAVPDSEYTTCPGVPCGDGNYCLGDKPYCCDPATKDCQAKADCSEVQAPVTCTLGGDECAPNEFCCQGQSGLECGTQSGDVCHPRNCGICTKTCCFGDNCIDTCDPTEVCTDYGNPDDTDCKTADGAKPFCCPSGLCDADGTGCALL